MSTAGSNLDAWEGRDECSVRLERGLFPSLICGTSVDAINGAKIAEGEIAPQHGLRGLERTWLTLDRNEDMWLFEPWVRNADRNRVFVSHLRGGNMQFRKAKLFGIVTEVKRVAIDNVEPGSRITFSWVRD